MPTRNTHQPRSKRDPFAGARVREWRLEQDLTQAALAEIAGVSRETIYRMELGRPPSSDTVQRIELALDLPGGSIMPLWETFAHPHDAFYGTKVRERRRALGLTLFELALETGHSVAKLSRFERNLSTAPDIVQTCVDECGREHRAMQCERLARALRFVDVRELNEYCMASDARRWRVVGDRRSGLRFDPEASALALALADEPVVIRELWERFADEVARVAEARLAWKREEGAQ